MSNYGGYNNIPQQYQQGTYNQQNWQQRPQQNAMPRQAPQQYGSYQQYQQQPYQQYQHPQQQYQQYQLQQQYQQYQQPQQQQYQQQYQQPQSQYGGYHQQQQYQQQPQQYAHQQQPTQQAPPRDPKVRKTATSATTEQFFADLLRTPNFQSLDQNRSELIGQGQFGIVWKVFETRSQQWYALKICPAQKDAWKQYKTEVLISQFLRKTWKDPSYRHVDACLPTIYHEYLDDKFFYLFMEYIQSIELSRYYISSSTTPAYELYDSITLLRIQHVETIVMQLLLTVQFLHSKGIIHRDIKPDNILLIPPENIPGNAQVVDGRKRYSVNIPIVKLIDFGLSKHVDMSMLHVANQSLTQSQAVPLDPLFQSSVGTPLFLSPESFENKNSRSGVAVDLFSIGVLALYLAFGYCPGYSDPRQIKDQTALSLIRKKYTFADYEREYQRVYQSHYDFIHHKQRFSNNGQTQLICQSECKLSPGFREALQLLFDLKPENRRKVYQTEWYMGSLPKIESNLKKYLELIQRGHDSAVSSVLEQSQAIIQSASQSASQANIAASTGGAKSSPQAPEVQPKVERPPSPQSDPDDVSLDAVPTARARPLNEREQKIKMANQLPIPQLLHSIINQGKVSTDGETDLDVLQKIHRVQSDGAKVGMQMAVPQYETVAEGDEENEDGDESQHGPSQTSRGPTSPRSDGGYEFDDDVIPCNPFETKHNSIKTVTVNLTASTPLDILQTYSYDFAYYKSFRKHYKSLIAPILALNNVNRVMILPYMWFESSKKGLDFRYRREQEELILLKAHESLPVLNVCFSIEYLNSALRQQLQASKASTQSVNPSGNTNNTKQSYDSDRIYILYQSMLLAQNNLQSSSPSSPTPTPAALPLPPTPNSAPPSSRHAHAHASSSAATATTSSTPTNSNNQFVSIQNQDMSIIGLESFDAFKSHVKEQTCRLLYILSLLALSVQSTQQHLDFLHSVAAVYRQKFTDFFTKDPSKPLTLEMIHDQPLSHYERLMASTYSRCLEWLQKKMVQVETSLKSMTTILQSSLATTMLALEHAFITAILARFGIIPVFPPVQIPTATAPTLQQNPSANHRSGSDSLAAPVYAMGQLAQHLIPSNAYVAYGGLVYRIARRYVPCIDCPSCQNQILTPSSPSSFSDVTTSTSAGVGTGSTHNHLNQSLEPQPRQRLHWVEVYHLIRIPTFRVIKSYVPPPIPLSPPTNITASPSFINQGPGMPLPSKFPQLPAARSQSFSLAAQIPTIYLEWFSMDLYKKRQQKAPLVALPQNNNFQILAASFQHDLSFDPFTRLFTPSLSFSANTAPSGSSQHATASSPPTTSYQTPTVPTTGSKSGPSLTINAPKLISSTSISAPTVSSNPSTTISTTTTTTTTTTATATTDDTKDEQDANANAKDKIDEIDSSLNSNSTGSHLQSLVSVPTSRVHIYSLLESLTSTAPAPKPIQPIDYDIELTNQAPYANVSIKSGVTVIKRTQMNEISGQGTTTTTSISSPISHSVAPIAQSHQLGNSIHFSLPKFTTLQISTSQYSHPTNGNNNTPATKDKTKDPTNAKNIDSNDKIPFFTTSTSLDSSIRLLSYASIRQSVNVNDILSSAMRKLVNTFDKIAQAHKISFDITNPQSCQLAVKSRHDSNQSVPGNETFAASLYRHSGLSKNDDISNLALIGQKEHDKNEERLRLLQYRLAQWSHYLKQVIGLFGIDVEKKKSKTAATAGM